MARLPRLSLSGYPHHIIQRGNNRQPVFLNADDYSFFLSLLLDQSSRHKVKVHAYVLMPNHFHLLVTPEAAEGLSKMMQSVGRAYAQYFNKAYQRSGTLWEGRYRSTVLEAETYLLPCMVYMDLNPVRSGLVSIAQEYPWSSCAHWLGMRNERLLTSHACYWALGNTPFAREAAYGEILQSGLDMQQQQAITDSALNGWALGSVQFKESLGQKTSRRVVRASPGRPKKTVNTTG